MQPKFQIGDTVTYNDGITLPFTSTVIEIKFSSSYQYLYKLKGKNIFLSDKFLK